MRREYARCGSCVGFLFFRLLSMFWCWGSPVRLCYSLCFVLAYQCFFFVFCSVLIVAPVGFCCACLFVHTLSGFFCCGVHSNLTAHLVVLFLFMFVVVVFLACLLVCLWFANASLCLRSDLFCVFVVLGEVCCDYNFSLITCLQLFSRILVVFI